MEPSTRKSAGRSRTGRFSASTGRASRRSPSGTQRYTTIAAQSSSFRNYLFADNATFGGSGEQLSSGDYYFTLQALGDGSAYNNSAVISSEDLPNGVYHYEAPSENLKTPSAGNWEWPAAIWDDRQETDERIKTYAVDYGYSESPAQSKQEINFIGGDGAGANGEESRWLQEELTGNHGAGWYYFRVQPLSADIERWGNGEWSPWSGGYNLLEASRGIAG